jgi:hypothetical protein
MELFHEPMDGNAEFIRQSRPLPDESGVPLAGWFTVPMRAFAIKEVSQKHLGNAGLSRRSFRAKADVSGLSGAEHQNSPARRQRSQELCPGPRVQAFG